MTDTMETIQRLGDERHELYKLAGHQALTPTQLARLHDLNSRLPILWDEHRRELASRHLPGQTRTSLNAA